MHICQNNKKEFKGIILLDQIHKGGDFHGSF